MLPVIDKQLSSQSFAVLQIDNLQLAFPQYQIASVNLVSDIDTRTSAAENIGWIMKDNQAWSIYVMSNTLAILSSLPKQGRFCVCFHPVAGQHYIGLVVDAVMSLELHDLLVVQSLPDCMHNPQSPVTQIFKNEDKLVFMSDVEYLYRYVRREEDHL